MISVVLTDVDLFAGCQVGCDATEESPMVKPLIITRLWLMSPGLAVLILLGAAGSATATPTMTTVATAKPFQYQNVRVEEVWVHEGPTSGSICVAAEKTTRLSQTQRVVERQAGCSETSSGYRYDPIGQTARAEATFRTYKTAKTQWFEGRRWVTISSSEGHADVTVDLTWTAAGTGISPRVIGPSICYGGTIVCYTSAHVDRRAEVAGSIHFHGLDMWVPVPSRHPGTLSVG